MVNSGQSLSYIELAFIKLRKNKQAEYNPEKAVAIAQETQAEYKKEEAKRIIEEDNYDIDALARILMTATKEEKEKDFIIYNRLELYKFDPQKRRFYDLLSRTKFFASTPDALVVEAPRDVALSINEPDTNRSLFKFTHNEFGIDKVVIAFGQDIKDELIQKFKNYQGNKNYEPVQVKKYEIEKEKTDQEKIDEVFGTGQ